MWAYLTSSVPALVERVEEACRQAINPTDRDEGNTADQSSCLLRACCVLHLIQPQASRHRPKCQGEEAKCAVVAADSCSETRRPPVAAMGRWAALLITTALAGTCLGAVGAATAAQWQSLALQRPIPLVNIPAGAPLPTLPVLSGPVLLDMDAARITVRQTALEASAVAPALPGFLSWKELAAY